MPLIVEAQRVRVAICYRNYADFKGISHIGLGVSAMQNCRALKNAGYYAEVWPITSAADLIKRLDSDRELLKNPRHIQVTHVVISALWMESNDVVELLTKYHTVQFVVVSHSNIGFLQVEPNAIKRLREGGLIERCYTNFHIAANSHKFVTWWEATYQTPMLHIPNMYPTENAAHPKKWQGGKLRIGCFCAVRPYKNIITAAAAALEIGVRLRVSDLEFYISGGRMEAGGSQTILNSIQALYTGVGRSRLIQNNWSSWPEFVKTVATMDLLLQPSFTEGFNMVTADGIVSGVPSVISDAIDWAPQRWMAVSDAASDVADVGVSLLHDPGAAAAGLAALNIHNQNSLISWKKFLEL